MLKVVLNSVTSNPFNELLTDNKNNGWQHNCHTFFNTDISHKMSAVLKQGKGNNLEL
jgi:hypothetical protein